MPVLVLADHDNARLQPATLSVVTAAKAFAEPIAILVVGHGCAAAAEAASRIPGIERVLVCDDARYEHLRAEPVSVLIAGLAGAYGAVLASTSTTAKNIMPRVAALLDVAPISDIAAALGPDRFVRPVYAGNVLATVQSSDRIKVITVRTSQFEKTGAEGGSAAIEAVPAGAASESSRFVGHQLSVSERPELTGARVVISGGRGMASGENFKLLEAVADKLGAAVGASRAAVDAGFVGNDYQVGQTGKIVAPELYIAVGISGAIQHLAGMKDSKVIVAINKDAEAPI
ncbi:MAG: electron transfer flavoprotein subunit alpha/FixB family protein, partial [Alphaproteobacteria bacterium]|nr:electron transfer flavoprotein subunit alpha/FixB family protein [Alphaproteobacteria bacterium]